MTASDGPGRWTVHDVLAHLVDLEESDRGWLARIRHIVEGRTDPLPRVDGTRHVVQVASAGTGVLLDRWMAGRQRNLAMLPSLIGDGTVLARIGRHPDLGPITAGQLLHAWWLHDLDHLAQITRIVGVCTAGTVGPIATYLRICRPAAPD
jgi:hypothetical protein